MSFLQYLSRTQNGCSKNYGSPSKLDPELEQFTIDFSQDSIGISLNLKWDKTIVSIPIE